MEQNQWIVSLFPGKEDILLPMSGIKRLLWQTWDESRHCNADWELDLIVKGSCRIDVDNRC